MSKKIGFTCGAMDLLHAGHVLMLKECREQCDFLIVGLEVDPSVDRPDKRKPIETVEERKIRLEGCRYVDKIVTYTSEVGLYNLLKELNPDVRFMGADWKNKPNYSRDLLPDMKVIYNSRDHNYSSSDLRRRILVSGVRDKEELVSIVLPTYNGADLITDAIKSVLVQSYKNWELLVIDDGSKDSTCEIVRNLIKEDTRIKYLKNEVNLGIQKTLNIGIKEAKGKYVARIDDDDLWSDVDKLRKQVMFLKNNPGYFLVGTGAIIIDSNEHEQTRLFLPLSDNEIRRHIVSFCCFFQSSVVFVKEIAIKLGGYSELLNTKHAEDYDLWLRLGIEGKFANIPSYSITLTDRNKSVSTLNRNTQIWHSLEFSFKYFNFYPNKIRQLFMATCKFIFLFLYQFTPISKKTYYNIKKFIEGTREL